MMPSSTVRINERTHQTLKELARASGKPMQAILEHAIEEERRRRFFDEADAAYAQLRADPKAWAEYKEEMALWDTTLMDGLEDEPPYPLPAATPVPKAVRGKRK